MSREPFPLQWPGGWPRTSDSERCRARFHTSLINAAREVRLELERIGANNVAITTNMPTRRDGLPYSTAKPPDDAGVAAWWVTPAGMVSVIACDRWDRVQDNARAIAASLEAMRALDRWGAGQVAQRARATFNALPSGEAAPIQRERPWRDVLGGFPVGIGPADLLALAKYRHRTLIIDAHPDRAGGSHAAAAQLNAALEQAELELGQ